LAKNGIEIEMIDFFEKPPKKTNLLTMDGQKAFLGVKKHSKK
jgi:arsenate reductase-like glutaredoxin family protein